MNIVDKIRFTLIKLLAGKSGIMINSEVVGTVSLNGPKTNLMVNSSVKQA